MKFFPHSTRYLIIFDYIFQLAHSFVNEIYLFFTAFFSFTYSICVFFSYSHSYVVFPLSLSFSVLSHKTKQMCEELERMHPRVYMNISRHISRAPFGELEEAHTAPYLLNAVAKDLFKSGINWAKIVSIFTVSGGLAVDIVRQGHYDYLPRLIESTGDIVEDDLVPWLMDNGGWSGLLEHANIRPNDCFFDRQFTPYQWITIATTVLFICYALAFIYRSMSYLTS